MDRIRAFLAFELPEEPRREISKVFSPFMRKYPNIKWVPEENYHITLVFLGEVPIHFLESLQHPMENLVRRYSPFRFALNGWGTFPPGRRLFNVLWVGLNYEKTLLQFHRELSRITGVFERREYTPHITVARNGRRKVSFDEDVIIPDLEFTVGELTLFQSILRREGPLYRALRRFPFGK